jgi:serine/threonine-protein kinase PknG
MILGDPVIADLDNRCSACRAELTSGVGPEASMSSLPSRCPRCDADVSQRRPLEPDEIIGHQYRIRGCVGRGGQGWVYLAHDLNLDNDPVAIKGVRDAAHQESLAAELRSLIAVKHPDIVAVRNYVQYPDPATGRLDGYIVMEFLDGVSLADKVLAAGGRLPVGEALAYVLATLPALGYLHDAGLVYGDYKPQNIMQSGDRVKLVDLGAVTPIGPAAGGRAWATRGFAAPEILRDGPSAASDVHCVGRTLALLAAPFEMADAAGAILPLPTPMQEPVFAKYESFYRLLLRATAPDPQDRFGSVGRFADQLTGVLREVVAIDKGIRSSAPSTLFTAEHGVIGGARDATGPAAAALALPAPRPEENEPAAALLEAAGSARPAEAVRLLSTAPRYTAEVAYRLALAQLGLGDVPAARTAVRSWDSVQRDWRTTWYGAVVDLADGRPQDAWSAFAAIRDALPGEAAPKLALAACAEADRRHDLARHYYATVWTTDDSYVGAAFGVARCETAAAASAAGTASAGTAGSAPDAARRAIDVLESIPDRLHHHVAARVEALRLRLEDPGLDLAGLRDVVSRLEKLKLDDERSLLLEVRLWDAARTSLRDGRLGAPSAPAAEPLLGVRLTDEEIARALERCHLLLRRYAPTRREVAARARTARLARPRTRW